MSVFASETMSSLTNRIFKIADISSDTYLEITKVRKNERPDAIPRNGTLTTGKKALWKRADSGSDMDLDDNDGDINRDESDSDTDLDNTEPPLHPNFLRHHTDFNDLATISLWHEARESDFYYYPKEAGEGVTIYIIDSGADITNSVSHPCYLFGRSLLNF